MRAYKYAIRGVLIALACVIVPQSVYAVQSITTNTTLSQFEGLPTTGSDGIVLCEDITNSVLGSGTRYNYPNATITWGVFPPASYTGYYARVLAGASQATLNTACTTNNYTNYNYSYLLYSNGTTWVEYTTPPVDGITTTIEPTADTFFVNNPVPFQGLYNNGITGAYDQIQFDLTNTTQAFQMAITKPTTLVSGTDILYSFEQALPLQGTWDYNVRLWDTANATGTSWFIGNSFMLGTTTTATTTPVFNAPDLECSTFDLTCYIKKAFIWLIYPTESVKESFDSFITTIQSKPPVGYFNLLRDNLQGINASSTPAVTVTIPASIKSVFFTPFDIAIAGILWFFFGIHFYKRLKDITL